MELIKVIALFIFLKVDFESDALNNTSILNYGYIKQQVVNVCSEFFERSVCIWGHSKYGDLKSFILRECSHFVPVLQFTLEGRVISECKRVLLLEENHFSICEMILQNRLTRINDILVVTHNNISGFSSELNKCSASFDYMNVVIVSLQNGETTLLNTTVSAMHYFVQGGDIKRNCKLIIPDFHNKSIKVATFDYPPFSIIKNNSGSVEYYGIEMSLFRKLSVYLNFTWELVPLKSPGRFGKRLNNGTVIGGVTQALREGAADIGFCNFWQRDLAVDSMEFGPALNMIYVTFIVRRPYQLLDQWQALFMIFTVHVWMTIAATFLAITFVYWQACRVVSIISRKPSLLESAVIMFGILTVSSSYSIPVSFTSRLVTMWSFLFALLLMTAVTSSIVTRLTLPLYSPRVDTVKQLVDGNYYWTDPSYRTSNKANKEFFFDLNNKLHRTFESRYKYIRPQVMESRVLTDRNIVLPVQRWGTEHVLVSLEGVNGSTDLSNFRVMRGYTQIAFTSFGFRRHSGYNEAFNRVIQRFIEFGLWEYQKHKMTFQRINRKYLLEEEEEHNFSSLQQLALINLYPAFVLLVMGLSVALVVLLMELIYYNLCTLFTK